MNNPITYLTFCIDNWRNAWIGGFRDNTSAQWKWTGTNQEITWFNWYPGKPSSIAWKHCMGLRRGFEGQWNNFNCTLQLRHVCEFVMG